MEDINNKISLKNELLRKSIHLSSSVIPISYFFLNREAEIIILTVLTIVLIIIDLMRIRNERFKKFYLKFFEPMLRGHEVNNRKLIFTGGTYIVWAFLICVILFPKPIAIASMFIIIFSDSFAAIVGKVYGKHFINNKTIEGSIAFFFTGIIIILLTPKVTESINEYYFGIASVFLTTIFEILPNKIDDNITIPIFFGFVYFALIKIFL